MVCFKQSKSGRSEAKNPKCRCLKLQYGASGVKKSFYSQNLDFEILKIEILRKTYVDFEKNVCEFFNAICEYLLIVCEILLK